MPARLLVRVRVRAWARLRLRLRVRARARARARVGVRVRVSFSSRRLERVSRRPSFSSCLASSSDGVSTEVSAEALAPLDSRAARAAGYPPRAAGYPPRAAGYPPRAAPSLW